MNYLWVCQNVWLWDKAFCNLQPTWICLSKLISKAACNCENKCGHEKLQQSNRTCSKEENEHHISCCDEDASPYGNMEKQVKSYCRANHLEQTTVGWPSFKHVFWYLLINSTTCFVESAFALDMPSFLQFCTWARLECNHDCIWLFQTMHDWQMTDKIVLKRPHLSQISRCDSHFHHQPQHDHNPPSEGITASLGQIPTRGSSQLQS